MINYSQLQAEKKVLKDSIQMAQKQLGEVERRITIEESDLRKKLENKIFRSPNDNCTYFLGSINFENGTIKAIEFLEVGGHKVKREYDMELNFAFNIRLKLPELDLTEGLHRLC